MSSIPLNDPRLSRDRAFLGHPAGLGWLAFCEFWERFSYYGMQALLVLYLSNYLFLPENIGNVAGIDALRAFIERATGPRSPQQLASAVFGLYAGLVYLTPIFGGLVADRLLGRTRTVVIGASLMALGHFLMAFEASFLLALACLLLGVGCFKGNIAAQVGALYAPGDKRRASAFQIFMLSVQMAVILAPIVCGTLGEKVAWHWGFGAAGVGMLIGLVVYLAGRRYLPPEEVRVKTAMRSAGEVKPRMSSQEKARFVLLIALIPVLMLSIVGNQQFNNAYPLWSQKHMDLLLFGFQVPVSWLQAVDALISTSTMVASIAFWRWWATRRREPDELTKMAFGALLAACAPALLVIAAGSIAGTNEKVSFVWTLGYTLINNLGFANILPVGIALYSRAAPRRLEGLMIGIYYLHLFLGNSFVGWLAGLLDEMSGTDFWGLHAVLVASAGVLLLAVKFLFGRVLLPDEGEPLAGQATGQVQEAR
ncbi:peptide MFS transporter [Paucibacter sp. B2R-40]|uniref:peptide MFS transporter n=1 Tax=Paucibacter sp. B2R-40 TaxID=2893554 RepID=UPI0021E42427|nr:peptide MFS transporter [Paucibacter sp. B2R-40]MCV2354884.1 peptide MFS transporter [Paucibacter sp. B2R-40]